MGEYTGEQLEILPSQIVSYQQFKSAYPYSITQIERVINDEIAGEPIVVFHIEGARSAHDAPDISESRKDGSTGAFSRIIDEKPLTFEYDKSLIRDEQTGSNWDIAGKAISGPMEGAQLKPLISGYYFDFAWLVFWLETEILNQ